MLTNPFIVKALVVAVVLCLLALLAIKSAPHAREFRRAGLLLLAIAAMLYGGTKPPSSKFAFDGGIKDAVEPSYTSNDTVVVRWQLDPRAIFAPPDNAPVYIDYRPRDLTRGWRTLAQSVVNAWGWSGELEAATNYDFNVYAYYFPPEPVHTNGVWEYRPITDPEKKRGIIPLRATIKADDRTIYPPKEN